MSSQELNIRVSLSNELTSGLNAISASLEDFEKKAKRVGRDIKEVGEAMAMVGGGITGAFALALNTAAKSSFALNSEFQKLSTVSNQFQVQIGQAVLPVVKDFTQVIVNLFNSFNNLPMSLKETILQGALIAGMFLTIGGILTAIIGKVVVLATNIASLTASFLSLVATNPMLVAIAGAVALIVFAMLKWKAVADAIISTFEVMFRFILNGFLYVETSIAKIAQAVLDKLYSIVDALAKIPGPTQEAFRGMADQIKQTSLIAGEFADLQLQEIINNSEKIGETFNSGSGDWSNAFNNAKESFINFKDQIISGNSAIREDTSFLNAELIRMENDLKRLRTENADQEYLAKKRSVQEQINLEQFFQQEHMIAMQGAAALTVAVGKTIQQSLSSALSDIILGAKTAKEAFTELGKALIKAVVDFIAQKLVAFALEQAMLALHIGVTTAAAAATASAWAPAAAMVSLATFGANSVPASAGIASTVAIASALAAPIPRAFGGDEIITKPTLFLAGERGPERATFSPIGSKGFNGGGNNINIYIESPRITSSQDITKLGEDLGFEIERTLRSARGI